MEASSQPSHPFRPLRFAVAMCWLAAVFSFPQSTAFALRDITVTGNRTLSDAEIVRHSGLRIGRPLPADDAERAAASLLSIPVVRGATVHFVWPSRAIVTVTERSPLLALRWSGGVLVVDEEGVPFRRQDSPQGLVPLSLESELAQVTLGEHVPHRQVRDVAAAFAALDGTSRAEVARLEVDAHGDLNVGLTSGVTLRVGQPADLERKLRLAQEVMRALAGRGIAVRELDLRFGDRVVARPER
jgi:cell division septal protein FtsQ